MLKSVRLANELKLIYITACPLNIKCLNEWRKVNDEF